MLIRNSVVLIISSISMFPFNSFCWIFIIFFFSNRLFLMTHNSILLILVIVKFVLLILSYLNREILINRLLLQRSFKRFIERIQLFDILIIVLMVIIVIKVTLYYFPRIARLAFGFYIQSMFLRQVVVTIRKTTLNVHIL